MKAHAVIDQIFKEIKSWSMIVSDINNISIGSNIGWAAGYVQTCSHNILEKKLIDLPGLILLFQLTIQLIIHCCCLVADIVEMLVLS